MQLKLLTLFLLSGALAGLVMIGYRAWTSELELGRNHAAAPSTSRGNSSGEATKPPAEQRATGASNSTAPPEIDPSRASSDVHLPEDPEAAALEVDPARPDRTDWAVDGVDAGYDKCRACILDPMAPPLKKASALRFLNDGGPSGMALEIVQAVAELLDTTPDPQVRAALCWGLVAVPAEEAIQALLRRLRVDMDDRVRQLAVSALGPSTSREDVHVALEHVWRHDASECVRERARKVLGESE